VILIINMLETLKSIADPTRYKIVNLLLHRDYCVGKLSRILDITESAVSQHLKILREAGLVSGEKKGYFMHYKVERTLLQEVAEHLLQLVAIQAIEADCHVQTGKSCACCRKESIHGPDTSRNEEVEL
jgi:ArsR family transcriptional regulator, arsenate/arsenite/antimonite-responsive transcriptional repressor